MSENNLQNWNNRRNRNRGRDRNEYQSSNKQSDDIRTTRKSYIDNENKEKKIKNVDFAGIIPRTINNNKIVEHLTFKNPLGESTTINGGLLQYFTLTPSKPLIDCKYLRMLQTIESYELIEKVERNEFVERVEIIDSKNKDTIKPGMVERKEVLRVTEKLMGGDKIIKKKNVSYIRGCIYGKKDGEVPEPCVLTNEKIAEKRCMGNSFTGSSLEFYVISNGLMEKDTFDEEKPFRILYVNKQWKLLESLFKDNSDIIKRDSLFNFYNAMKDGRLKMKSKVNPGNTLFHTLFSGEVDVEIETLSGGDKLKGTVKGYELTPGGHPSLNVWTGEGENKRLRFVPLYMIGTMEIIKYKLDDLLSKRAVEMTLKGHIVIPHRGNNCIYDYCKTGYTGEEQEIKLNGTIYPNNDDNHDMELRKIISEIKNQ